MKPVSVVLGLWCALWMSAGMALAGEPMPGACTVCETAESNNYVVQAGGKMERGLVNAGLGWSELVARQEVPDDRTKPEQQLARYDLGLRKAVKRTILGVGEFLTFLTPPRTPRWTEDCSLGVMGVTGR